MNQITPISNTNFNDTNFEVEAYCKTISTDFSTWETNEAKTANEALYALLARCYLLSLEYDKNPAMMKKVEALLVSRGSIKRKDSTSHGRVLNLVFDDAKHTKRRSVYAKAMKKAQTAGVEAVGLAAWFTQQGGLEALRDVKKATKKEQAARKKAYQTGGKKALIERDALSKTVIDDLPTGKAKDGLIVVVCKMDGTSAIPVALVDGEEPLNAVLKWASQQKAPEPLKSDDKDPAQE